MMPTFIHKQTARTIKKYHQDVSLIIAKDEIESWLLADEGLCKWLGIKAKNRDEDKQPSNILDSAVKKTSGKKYTLMRETVLKKLDGTGDKHSLSMKKAVQRLQNAPCFRQIP